MSDSLSPSGRLLYFMTVLIHRHVPEHHSHLVSLIFSSCRLLDPQRSPPRARWPNLYHRCSATETRLSNIRIRIGRLLLAHPQRASLRSAELPTSCAIASCRPTARWPSSLHACKYPGTAPTFQLYVPPCASMCRGNHKG